MLNDNRSSLLEAARNQYRATLQAMSFEAVYKIAWDEHRIRGKATQPKSELIEAILNSKYGKET